MSVQILALVRPHPPSALPASSHFEHHDIYAAYGQSYLQRAEPVIPPVGESAPNTAGLRSLAARFGFDQPLSAAADLALMDAAVDAGDPRLHGQRPSQLPLTRALLMATPAGDPVLVCGTVPPDTASGKVDLYSDEMQTCFGYGVPRYEAVHGTHFLMLITPSSAHRTNATFGGGVQAQCIEHIELHPDDEAARGIEDGDEVRSWNARGEVGPQGRPRPRRTVRFQVASNSIPVPGAFT